MRAVRQLLRGAIIQLLINPYKIIALSLKGADNLFNPIAF